MTTLSRRSLLINSGLTAIGGAAVLAAADPDAAAQQARSHHKPAHHPISVAYVEVNNYQLRNVADYALARTGASVFDLGIIFAANINYDGQRAQLFCNPQVQATLDDAVNQIRPLQARGIKVLLSILGNHQGAGLANFPDRAAATAFARQLADIVVRRYDLDGIDFDDEYSDYGTNATPQPNAYSFVYLVSALRRLMPHKIISLYDIGPASTALEYRGVQVGRLIDYAWNPYYGSWGVPDVPGLHRPQLGPAAIEINATDPTTAADLARQTVDEHYGVFLTYNLPDQDSHDYLTSFTRPLYGSAAVHLG
ncbi:chitinase [Microlunatus endophyticus]|uniref:Chitinase n=1 Tax=Microlunatus endophyticus TaxID=1716077 RepID=A0A917VZ64_9ACTN|nr:endo-beta-N-acetylglucosaminidase H [Microlunatus endophyticus]GGL47772.1 chitinase [Microlunatus endophyticus]